MKKRTIKDFLPVILAGCLFLMALFLYLFTMANGEKQAARILKELYTVDADQGLYGKPAEELSADFDDRFGKDLTEKGRETGMQTGLPYVLLYRDRPVDKTYAKVMELQEVKMADAGEKDKDETDEKTRFYTYRIRLEFYYDKGDEVLQPVTEEWYSGSISMKKTELLKWKMDSINLVQTQ